jgi:hypothetical protein
MQDVIIKTIIFEIMVRDHRSKRPRYDAERTATGSYLRRRAALSQNNKVMNRGNLLVMLECLQSDLIVLAGIQAVRTKIVKRAERQIHRVFRL